MSIINKIISHSIQVLSILIMSLTIYLVIVPGIKKVQEKIKSIQIEYIEKIESDNEIIISYESISPLIVNSIILKNVIVKSQNLENSINISDVEIKFSILNIIKSNWKKIDPPAIISSIILKGGDIELNFEDNWLKEKFKSKGETTNNIFKTKLFLKDINVYLNFKLLQLNIENIKGVLSSKNHRYNTNLKTKITYVSKLTNNDLFISGDSNIRGVLSNNFIDIISHIKLYDISSNLGKISDLDVDLNLINFELDIKNRKNNDLFNFTYLLKIPTLEMFVNIDAEKLTLNDIFTPNDDLKFSKYKDEIFSGNLKLSYDHIRNNIFYSSKGDLLLKKVIEPYTIRTNFDVVGNLDYLTFNKLNINTPKGYIGFNGGINLKTFFPNGKLYLRNLEVTEKIKLNSDILINKINDSFINIHFDYIEGNNLRIEDISSILFVDDENLSFQAIKKNSTSDISLSGNFNRLNKSIKSSIIVKETQIEFLDKIINANYFKPLKDSKVSFNAGFDYLSGDYNLDIKNFVLNSINGEKILETQGIINNYSFSLDYINLNLPNIHMQGSIDGKFNNSNVELFIDSLINDNKYKFNVGINEGNIKIDGSYGLDAELIMGETTYLNIVTKEFPLNYRDFNVTTSFNMKSAMLNNDDFLISMPYFSMILNHPSLPFDPNIEFSLDGSNKKIDIKNLKYKDNHTPLFGNINFNFEETNMVSVIMNLTNNDKEKYSLKSLISTDLENIMLDFKVDNFLLDRLELDNLKGQSSLLVSISGDKQNFKGMGSFKSNNIKINNNLSGLNFDFNIDENQLNISDLVGYYQKLKIKLPLLTYNYIEGNILSQLDINLINGNNDFFSNMDIKLSLNPLGNLWALDNKLLQNINGEVNILKLTHNSKDLFTNKSFKIFNNKSALQVYSVDRNLKLLYSHITGLVNLKIIKPYIAEFSATGIIKDGNIDLSIKDINIDGLIINNFIKTNPADNMKIVDFDTLNLHGQMKIGGSLSDPLLNGLFWADALYNVKYIDGNIEQSRFNIRLVDNICFILPGSIEFQDIGRLDLQGEILLESWKPESIIINMKINKSNKIPIKYKHNRIITDLNIYSPELVYYWDNSGSLITGSIIVEDSEFYTQILNVTESSEEIVKKSDSSFEVDVLVEFGNNNKLYWPTKNFPVLYATASPGDKVDIGYKSINGDFSVVGKISIINGEVDYSGKPFVLKEGEVVLDLSKELLDPYIHIVGTKTVIDENNRQVEVTLDFEGGFFSDFKPTFSSSDSTKTEDEIRTLVGLAVVGDDIPTLFIDVVDEFATSLLTAPVEEGLKDFLGVDDVKIKSGFISSFLNNALNITNNSFDSEDESVYNLSEMLNNTSLTLGNFITNDFFVKGSVGSVYENRELNPEVDLGLTLYSPHFQLGFSFIPKLADNYVFEPEIGISIEWFFNPQKVTDKEN